MGEKQRKIAFIARQFSMRGTEVALFDYAYYNREILGNESIILIKRNSFRAHDVEKKFRAHFEVAEYDDVQDLDAIATQKNINIAYQIKAGKNDGVLLKTAKNAIHVVFQHYDPHGEVYAYISPWLSEKMTGSKYPYVPHMVTLPKPNCSLREELNIPAEAFVLGRYGGDTTFDVKFVCREILRPRYQKNAFILCFHGNKKI